MYTSENHMSQSLCSEHVHLSMFRHEYLELGTGVRCLMRGLTGWKIKIALT